MCKSQGNREEALQAAALAINTHGYITRPTLKGKILCVEHHGHQLPEDSTAGWMGAAQLALDQQLFHSLPCSFNSCFDGGGIFMLV